MTHQTLHLQSGTTMQLREYVLSSAYSLPNESVKRVDALEERKRLPGLPYENGELLGKDKTVFFHATQIRFEPFTPSDVPAYNTVSVIAIGSVNYKPAVLRFRVSLEIDAWDGTNAYLKFL